MKKLLMIPILILLASMISPRPVDYYPNLRCPPLQMIRGMHITLDEDGLRHLHISFAGENQGPGHLIVVGEVTNINQIKVKATQVVGNSYGQWNALPHDASHFSFHGGNHGHWHWNGWAAYGLVRLDEWGPRAVGVKQSFCLSNNINSRKTEPAPGQLPVPAWNEKVYVSNLNKTYKINCNPTLPETMAQHVSAGYGDYYNTSFNEPILIASDGIYALIGVVDLGNHIKETNEMDNVGIVALYIRGKTVTYLGHIEL